MAPDVRAAARRGSLYKYPMQQKTELTHDRFAQLQAQYEQYGIGRSNRTYGYIRKRVG